MSEPITTSAIVAALAAKNGMPKAQLATIVGGMSDEQRQQLAGVVAAKGDVLATFDAIRDAQADAEAKAAAEEESRRGQAAQPAE